MSSLLNFGKVLALQQLYHNFATSYLIHVGLDSWHKIYVGLPYLSQ